MNEADFKKIEPQMEGIYDRMHAMQRRELRVMR